VETPTSSQWAYGDDDAAPVSPESDVSPESVSDVSVATALLSEVSTGTSSSSGEHAAREKRRTEGRVRITLW
jgi:hypothetical protein